MTKIKQELNRSGVIVYMLHDQPSSKSRAEVYEAIDFYQFAYERYKFGRMLFHVASERAAHVRTMNDLKQSGMISGISDYLLLKRRGNYNFLAIELKRARRQDSSISKDQTEFLKECMEEGGYACVAYGYKAALHVLDWYLNL